MRTLVYAFVLETLVNLSFFVCVCVFRYIIHWCSVDFPASSVLISLTVETKTAKNTWRPSRDLSWWWCASLLRFLARMRINLPAMTEPPSVVSTVTKRTFILSIDEVISQPILFAESMSHAGVSETWPTIKQAERTGWCQPALICERRKAHWCQTFNFSCLLSEFWAGSHRLWGVNGGCYHCNMEVGQLKVGLLKLRQKWLAGSYIWPWTHMSRDSAPGGA